MDAERERLHLAGGEQVGLVRGLAEALGDRRKRLGDGARVDLYARPEGPLIGRIISRGPGAEAAARRLRRTYDPPVAFTGAGRSSLAGALLAGAAATFALTSIVSDGWLLPR